MDAFRLTIGTYILTKQLLYSTFLWGLNELRECYTTLGFTVEVREGAIEQQKQYIAFG